MGVFDIFNYARIRPISTAEEDEQLGYKNVPGRLPVVKLDQLHQRLIIGWENNRYRKGPCLFALQKECVLSRCPKDEVLVRVFSTGVNHFEYKMQQGKCVSFWKFDAPKVGGGDFAGTVEFVHPKSKWKLGDRVIAATKGWRWDDLDYGTHAEQLTVPEEWCVSLPEDLSLDEIGGLPMPALTAWQALAKSQLPVEGARVLILNGSGAVGHLAVQLAKVHYGAHVTATTGPSNQELVSGLGADAVLDYTQAGWEEKLHGSQQQFDAIVDLVGGDAQEKVFPLLKPTGTFAHVVTKEEYADQPKPFIEKGAAWTHGPKYVCIEMEQDTEALGQIVSYVAKGLVRYMVDSVYTLDEGRAAYDHLEKGHCKGRVIFKIRDSAEE